MVSTMPRKSKSDTSNYMRVYMRNRRKKAKLLLIPLVDLTSVSTPIPAGVDERVKRFAELRLKYDMRYRDTPKKDTPSSI